MTYDVKYCIQRNIRPRFTFAPFALVVNRRILNWAYSNVLTYYSQLCLGEFKKGRNRLLIKEAENNTRRK